MSIHPVPAIGALHVHEKEDGPLLLASRLGAGICAMTEVGGAVAVVLHALLPSAAVAPQRARSATGLFVDAGLDGLLAMMGSRGVAAGRLELTVVGCAEVPPGGASSQHARETFGAALCWAAARRLAVLRALPPIGGPPALHLTYDHSLLGAPACP